MLSAIILCVSQNTTEERGIKKKELGWGGGPESLWVITTCMETGSVWFGLTQVRGPNDSQSGEETLCGLMTKKAVKQRTILSFIKFHGCSKFSFSV